MCYFVSLVFSFSLSLSLNRTAIKLSFHSISKENIAYDFVREDTPMDISHWNPDFL